MQRPKSALAQQLRQWLLRHHPQLLIHIDGHRERELRRLYGLRNQAQHAEMTAVEARFVYQGAQALLEALTADLTNGAPSAEGEEAAQ